LPAKDAKQREQEPEDIPEGAFTQRLRGSPS
jgi:hypothetical protein